MKVIAIIPARMNSSRFPGKPLKPILGLPMIEHVRRRVALCKDLSETIVATCDQEIKEVVEKFGGKAVMTADTYARCTDRIAEAARHFKADIIINVQGDEPLIRPDMLTEIIQPLKADKNLSCSNMMAAITDDESFQNPNVVKVVCDLKGNIIYFSREPIPSNKISKVSDNYPKLCQLGLIAFRADFLQKFTQLPETPLERLESVDMMRAIEHGYTIRGLETKHRVIGVDVPSDVSKVEEALKKDPLVQQYLSMASSKG